MKRHFASSIGLVAVWSGCSLVIDTSNLSGDGVAAGDAAVDSIAPATEDASVDARTPTDAADAADVVDAGDDTDSSDASVASDASDAGTCSTNLATDPKNCGSCGRDCLGGTCSEARCAPVAIVSGELGILGLAIDSTDMYWSKFDGSVRSAKLDGSSVGDLRKLDGTGHIEVDDTHVYVAGFGAAKISRFRKDGSGAVEVLAPCAGECLGIALNAGRVYFTERVGSLGNLRVVEADGGASPILQNLSFPEDVFAGSAQLFVANEGAHTILSVPYGSTSSAIVTTVTDPVSLVVDETNLWIVSQNTKTIRRRAVAGGPVITVVDLPSVPIAIAQSATAIYWTNEDGTILRLAK